MQIEYKNITVQFSEHSTPSVILTDEGRTYTTPRRSRRTLMVFSGTRDTSTRM